jgi:hypothetical protein
MRRNAADENKSGAQRKQRHTDEVPTAECDNSSHLERDAADVKREAENRNEPRRCARGHAAAYQESVFSQEQCETD